MPKKFKHFSAAQKLKAKAALAKASAKDANVTPVQSRLVINLAKARTETHNDRIYEIYPATILQEMVVKGRGPMFDKGPVLIPAAALEDTAFLWSDVPIIVNHPDFGLGNEQWELDESYLGRVFYPYFNSRTNELRAELWIDQEVAEKNDRWIDIKAQAEDKTLELSCAYMASDVVEKEGTFKGKPYSQVQGSPIPLHVALLPDEEGACSNHDGCGLNQAAETLVSGDQTNALLDFIDNLGENASDVQAKIKKYISGGGGAVAFNSKNDKEIHMNESIKKALVAALKSVINLSDAQADKLIGPCDCDDLATLVTANLTAVHTKAETVAGLETKVGNLEASLKVHTDKASAELEKMRESYLAKLGYSDDNPAIKETKTETLKAMALQKNLIKVEDADIQSAADAALERSDGEDDTFTPDAVSTTPKQGE